MAAFGVGHAGSPCGDLRGQIEAGSIVSSASGWKETDAAGRVLVSESGSLTGEVYGAAVRCDRWSAALQWQAFGGDRDYHGQTSLGAPLTTTSGIRQTVLEGDLGYQIADEIWLNLRQSQQTLDRTIRSVGNVSGYPEFYRRTVTAIGPKWERSTAFGTFSVFGWLAVAGSQTMLLQLPGKDPASMQWGSVNQWSVGARWHYPLGKGWMMALGVERIETTMDQSQEVPVFANGVPVAVASQPGTRMQELPISLSIGYNF